jgi:hypothetical protein
LKRAAYLQLYRPNKLGPDLPPKAIKSAVMGWSNSKKMKPLKRGINRRRFVAKTAQGISYLAATGAAMSTSKQSARAAAKSISDNPFAYDVSRFVKTDPSLIRYEEMARFTSPHPEPRRIDIGPQDRIYVANRNGIDVLDRDGAPHLSIKLSAPARCVAVTSDGLIYAGTRDRIEVFDPNAARVASYDIPGRKPWLTGLALGENDLLAADSGNRVVLRYDRAGKLVGRIGEKSKDRQIPGLIVPSPYLDVALGRDGLLRVNNPGRHCVELYTLNGDLELSWGKPSAGIEGFCGCCNPIGLALLLDGSCITCEKGLPRVKVYSAERSFDCVVAGPESFPENVNAHDLSDGTVGGLDAAVDSQGRVYILDLVTCQIRIMARKA